eukprot:3018635-Prymnesium_polylepis.1
MRAAPSEPPARAPPRSRHRVPLLLLVTLATVVTCASGIFFFQQHAHNRAPTRQGPPRTSARTAESLQQGSEMLGEPEPSVRERAASDDGSPYTALSCPTYSGPGFSHTQAQFVSVAGVRLAAPYTDEPTPPKGLLRQFSLRQVRLLNGTREWSSMMTNLEYILSLQPDVLLYSWRLNAGESRPPGHPAGGWEAPNMELRGHFLGHY